MIVLQTIDTKEVLGVYCTEQEAINGACALRRNGQYNVEVNLSYEESQEEPARAAS